MTTPDIALPRRHVLDSTMAYREAGLVGAPIALFLHGNPTSSYIWRHILPQVAPVATYMILSPFLGSEEAARISNGDGRNQPSR